MKRAYLPSLLVLSVILVFSTWNSAHMTTQTTRWQAQLSRVEQLGQHRLWSQAEQALASCYDDWSSRQTYLHIVSHHDVIDDAEAMFRRAQAFAVSREPSEFLAELSDLIDQLRLLAEMEQCTIKNIL